MMRKLTRETFRRVRLLKTFLISLIQILYFHFHFWLLNVIPKERDMLCQKIQPLQGIRIIWCCVCGEFFTEFANFFRYLICCSVFVLEKTRWAGIAKVFVQTKRILAFIRMALSLHANVQNLGWSLAREIWKKFLHVSIYLFWEYFISLSHKLYFSITRFINALHI